MHSGFTNPLYLLPFNVDHRFRRSGATKIDLAHEINQLESSHWKSGNQTTKTLVKEANLRIVLTLMKIKEHKAECVSIQVIDGRVRVRVGDNTVEFAHNQMLILHPGARHSIEALDDTAFTISIAESTPQTVIAREI
jgi:quercetin dioxygenase-like cupin family protein